MPNNTVLVFASEERYNTLAKEMAVTPRIEGGQGPVWIWYDPDSGENTIQPLVGADGRRAVCHHWAGVDREWLEAYAQGVTGLEVLDELPADWRFPAVEE